MTATSGRLVLISTSYFPNYILILSLQHVIAKDYHQITDISLTYSVYDNLLISNAFSLNYDVTTKPVPCGQLHNWPATLGRFIIPEDGNHMSKHVGVEFGTY
jgi:hypothetical protein